MRATFRFHGPLNDFLSARRRKRDVVFEAPVAPSVKDAIESLGPPHVEVAHVVVDGEPVGFEHLLADGQHVSVHPDDLTLAGRRRTAPPPPRPLRFVLDAHLRRLAVYLRLLGCDARWWRDAADADLARVSADEGRVLLTRDLGLLKRSVVRHGRFVRATDPVEQLREIVGVCALAEEARPFTRCLRCNGDVVPVPKQEVQGRLRPGTRRGYHRFRMCTTCDRVFWRGAHYGRLLRIVQAALPEWVDPRRGDEESAMADGGHWWEDFYSGLWLEAQRAMFDAQTSDQHAAFCMRVLGLTPGMRVLDAPCGDGRIALRLARAGCLVTGVDRAQTLLDEALASAAAEGLDLRFVRTDVRDLSYDAEFDAALCFWGSFGHFDDVGNFEQARVASRALRPGGRYLVDQPVLETFVNSWEPSGQREVGGITIVEERAWNAATGCIDCEWTLTRGDEREIKRSSIRVYTYREMIHLLEAAGFSSFEATGGYDDEEFGLGRRLCVIATK